MNPRDLKKIDLHVAVWGCVLSLGSIFMGDSQIFWGTSSGALLAIVNWFGFRTLAARLVGNARRKGRVAILLVLKTIGIMGAVAAVMLFARINIAALIVGLSSLIIGISSHSIQQAISFKETVLKEEA